MERKVKFPDLLGENAILPDPVHAYRHKARPPQHLVVALRCLSKSKTPRTAPKQWMAVADLKSPFFSPDCSFAKDRLHLRYGYIEKTRTYGWSRSTERQHKSYEPVELSLLKNYIWSEYSKVLIEELSSRQEAPLEAANRIEAEWSEWRSYCTIEFERRSMAQERWEPALSLAWMLFPNDWAKIATLLRDGQDTSLIELLKKGDPFGFEAGSVQARSALSTQLIERLRRGELICWGILCGRGATVKIPSTDIDDMHWACLYSPGHDAILERSGNGGTRYFYTNVRIERDGLLAALSLSAQTNPMHFSSGVQPSEASSGTLRDKDFLIEKMGPDLTARLSNQKAREFARDRLGPNATDAEIERKMKSLTATWRPIRSGAG